MQSLWMVAAALAFAVMGGLVKQASAQYSPFEVVLYRGLVCSVLIGVWIRYRRLDLGTGLAMMHVKRSVIGTLSMLCWFYAVGQLPLATGMTLNYTAPVFIAVLLAATTWWSQRRNGIDPAQTPGAGSRHKLYIAIAAGFAGVLIILRPSVDVGAQWAIVLGLLSGILSAFAYLQIRALGRIGEPEWRVVFYFSVINGLFGLACSVFTGFHALTWSGVGTLASIGVLALAGQLMMTRAFSRGRALLTANLQYSGIIFATLVGWVAFDERADWIEAAGMAMVITSGGLATWMSARERDPQPPRPIEAEIRIGAGLQMDSKENSR